MKITAIAAATIIAATSAHADTYWYCKGDECVGRSVGPSNPLGTYNNPIQDELEGDLSVPVHRGMYCAAGAWHHGWLRPWERSPVIKASCGSARQGRETGADPCKNQPGDACGYDRNDPVPGEFFHEQISKTGSY
jgi:hypothetical protein